MSAPAKHAPHDLEQYWNQHGDYTADRQTIDQPIPNPNPNQSGKDTEHPSEHALASWRALWQYSTKRAVRDNKTLTAQQNRAIDAIKGLKPARKPRFVHHSKKGLAFDQTAFDRAQHLIDLKGYVTNIPAHIRGIGQKGMRTDSWKVFVREGCVFG